MTGRRFFAGFAGGLTMALACGLPGNAGPSSIPDRGAPADQATGVPDVAWEVAYSADLHSYLEPCGCALYQMGGLARRARFLAERSAPRVTVENGGSVKGELQQDNLKLQTFFQVFGQIGLDAFNAGWPDLRYGADTLKQYAEESGVPVVSANLRRADGSAPFPAFHDLVRAGLNVRIVGACARGNHENDLATNGLGLVDPAAAIASALTAPWRGGEGLPARVVLLFYGTADQLQAQVPDLAGVTLAVVAEEGEAPFSFPRIVHGAPAVYAGKDGKMLGVAEFAADGALIRNAAHPLAHTISDDPSVRATLDMYLELLGELDLLGRIGRYDFPDGNEFVGSTACAACHVQEMAIWTQTKHASAWETLVAKKHDKDPECVVCHVVGLGHTSGFIALPGSAGLEDVGCEACHGPGRKHVAEQQPMPEVGDAACMKCHVVEHSPDYEWKTYSPRIRHWDGQGPDTSRALPRH